MIALPSGEHLPDHFDPTLVLFVEAKKFEAVLMKIGILEAGEPPPSLAPKFGTYDAMTRRLLGQGHAYRTFRVTKGDLPQGDECDAFVITGSACSAYDDIPWIGKLESFLQSIRYSARLVGICFGHQIMAQAFGGKVEKAPQGWGLGLRRYDILQATSWMDKVDSIGATASHQDQVTVAPPNTCVLGANDFTPFAILSYEDHVAMSFQFHPEFDPMFSRALFAARRAPGLANDDIEDAIGSMAEPNDNIRIGHWINRFLAT